MINTKQINYYKTITKDSNIIKMKKKSFYKITTQKYINVNIDT